MGYLDVQLELLRQRVDPAAPYEHLTHRELQVVTESLVYRWLADRQPGLIDAALRALAQLRSQQGPNGLFTTGDNLVSPPDSAFTVNGLCRMLRVLGRHPDEELGAVSRAATEIVTGCVDALVGGGVHTPNHRWEISCALVQLWHLFGVSACLDRAHEWLAEGVDLQPDGLFSERSPNYAVHVSGPCLLDMSTLLDRPDLADMVHKNLHATVPLVDERDRVETVQSRRQDQHTGFDLRHYGLLYRRVAIATGCPTCAAMAARAEASTPMPDVDAVGQCLIDPALAGPLPRGELPRPPRGWQVYETSQLAVWQEEGLRVVCHAASDVASLGRVASGISADPTFATVSAGGLSLGLRLSRSFFNLGPFRATHLGLEGETVSLGEQVESHYYQPLPPGQLRSDGDYPLEFEGRFAAQMAFSKRGQDAVSLTTTVRIRPRPDGVELEMALRGAGAPHVLEVALTGEDGLGAVEGDAHLRDSRTVIARGNLSLADGRLSLEVQGPLDPVAPTVDYNPGEAYTFLKGTDAVQAPRLLVPFRAPGRLRLLLRLRGRP